MTPDIDPAKFLQLLGRRVRLLRVMQSMTQDDLAEATGMSRSFVSLIEHGTHGVDVVRILRLAAVFGIPPAALFSPEPDGRRWLVELQDTPTRSRKASSRLH